jgi:drug/metabolite transporter (DMT)-like permease
MMAILLGLFAALCWALHDILARLFAGVLGAYRLAFLALVIGALLLVPVIGWRQALWQANASQMTQALAMGIAYAMALGGLFKAFGLAPVSIVGPLTSAYPAMVVLWGVVNGLAPTPLQWGAVVIIIVGAFVVSAYGPPDGGIKAIPQGKVGIVFFACLAAIVGFSASLVLGQKVAVTLGEFETTFISRGPAALLMLPLARSDTALAAPFAARGWLAVIAMALLDVLAVSGINHAGHFDNKEFAAMAIAAYGAVSVLLARLFLKENVSAGQWLGIAMLTVGVSYLGYASV